MFWVGYQLSGMAKMAKVTMLQRSIVHCIILQRSIVQCNIVQCNNTKLTFSPGLQAIC
jgi:hypothetical protein